MELGAFSVSLAVSDIARSLEFYERLGFVATGGDAEGGWQILRNHHTTIGLFVGMFERDMLTFNPGLDGATMMFEPHFTDVRDIQNALLLVGVELGEQADPSGSGAGHVTATDPDGNPILIDQFDMPDGGGGGLGPPELPEPPMPLELGPLTYGLVVADVERSADYYRAYGFTEFHGGDDGARWIAMRNGDAALSLHGLAGRDHDGSNTLTFNPGLDAGTREPRHDAFATVEEIEAVLIGRGLSPDRSVDPTGRRAVAFADPDGKRVLIHQVG